MNAPISFWTRRFDALEQACNVFVVLDGVEYIVLAQGKNCVKLEELAF
jgi:hypothetical protein